MHNTEAHHTATFNSIALGNLSIARLSACIIAGGIVTFGLFVAMNALIDQENDRPLLTEPIVVISSILDLPEEKTNIRPLPMPIPELKMQPITAIEMPVEPFNKAGFSTAVQIPAIAALKLAVNMGAVDQQPSPRIRVDPRYPASAASNGIEGFVRLSFGVSVSGEVVDIQIIDSQPRNTFDRAAKQALRKWRYQPKMVGGSAVGMDGLQVQLDFSLANN
jgi:protein TonB